MRSAHCRRAKADRGYRSAHALVRCRSTFNRHPLNTLHSEPSSAHAANAIDYDIVIVGGGPVGCALALGLGAARRSVLLLDASPELRDDDPRTLALSYGSRLILERLQVWPEISPLTAIDAIHISQRGGFGSTVLTAADAHTPSLGYVAPYASVQLALKRRVQETPNLRMERGARATAFEQRRDSLLVAFEHRDGETHVGAALAIIADGGVLAQQSAQMEVRDYAQSAVIGNVTASLAQPHIAFERFTREGPLALLPHAGGYALVWTVSPERAIELCSCPEDTFLRQLQEAFGMRVGTFSSVRDRATFPLALRVASDANFDRMLLIGNAAQALHPVAGQGLNLGLRDAWELADRLSAIEGDEDMSAVVKSYRRSREADRRTSVLLTDAMVRAFSNGNLALQWLRGCGLTFLDCVPAAKHRFMQQMIFGALW
jgi:2-octaprenyl-6-methoxyphenol hydroxylase